MCITVMDQTMTVADLITRLQLLVPTLDVILKIEDAGRCNYVALSEVRIAPDESDVDFALVVELS